MVGKLKYVLIALIIWLIPNISQVQADCSYERIAELSRIASNVQLSYTYEIGESARFDVTLTNLTNDIYVMDEEENVVSGAGEQTLSYDHGQDIKYTFYANDSNCYGEELLTQYITLPNFNEYSNYAGCTHYPQFKYCQLWANTEDITSEQFYSQLQSYAAGEDATVETVETQETSLWEAIKNVVDENLVMIIMCLVAIIILVTYVVIKKIRKMR